VRPAPQSPYAPNSRPDDDYSLPYALMLQRTRFLEKKSFPGKRVSPEHPDFATVAPLSRRRRCHSCLLKSLIPNMTFRNPE
jgi:hypothetical protein